MRENDQKLREKERGRQVYVSVFSVSSVVKMGREQGAGTGLTPKSTLAHAAPGSKTMSLSQEVISWEKSVYTFDHSSNQPLIAIGAGPIPAGEKK